MHFRKENLVEAMEARDMSGTGLADLVGRSAQSITHYIKGRIVPPLDVIEAMARALHVDPGFFFKPPRPTIEEPTFFRSLAATTKRARTRARRRIDWTFDVLRFLERYVSIQPARLPDLRLDWRTLTEEEIERAATELRRAWELGDGPIPSLVWLVEQHGIVVVRDSIGDAKLDAHSRWCADRPIIVLNTDKLSAVRSRFDCAHELGHMLLHREVPEAELHRPENMKKIEGQADRFAGAFMMPGETFGAEVGYASLDAFMALKPRWRMSIAAMLMRSEQLNLVSDSGGMWRSLARRGWRKREPFDDTLLPEAPRLMGRAFEVLLEHNLAPRDAVITETQLPQADIETLAGLGESFLTAERGPVLHLKPRLA